MKPTKDMHTSKTELGARPLAAGESQPDLRDPRVVLSVLETDQVVAAKQQTRFGRRDLTLGMRLLLWGLRLYVLAMLAIVLVSVARAIHAAH